MHAFLDHDYVLSLTVKLLSQRKFRLILANRYPILFIDEYQDTDKAIAEALITNILNSGEGPLIGFFGDHWQKIYGTGCGRIEHHNLQVIGKKANFRSVPTIVECLNRIRPELPQQVRDPSAQGAVAVYHSNDWVGTRLTGQHWGGDLPAQAAEVYLESLVERLTSEGWDFSPQKTKILMLTHKVLAARQGYDILAGVFEHNDAFIKKQDAHIAFLLDVLEPVCIAYEKKQFGEMFAAMGSNTPAIQSPADKVAWSKDMDQLLELRRTSTIGAVLDHLKRTQRPRLSEAVERRERVLEQPPQAATEGELTLIARLRQLRDVSYQEVIRLAAFIDDATPFSTKHGVKGAEFENVLVVFGRGWGDYNFNQFLEWGHSPPSEKRKAFERNRNLFYVSCSRPKTRLALLFTQKLSPQAMATLVNWFGSKAIQPLELAR
jgi:DNA helicase-2/ATP-dependent DNA helicase PcrA